MAKIFEVSGRICVFLSGAAFISAAVMFFAFKIPETVRKAKIPLRGKKALPAQEDHVKAKEPEPKGDGTEETILLEESGETILLNEERR